MDISKLTAGDKAPSEINVVIEIPQGSAIKYEYDKETGMIAVDRFLHTAMAYPFNYGFIPGTRAGDGDAIDVLLISSLPITPGATIKARPIGVLEMEDESGVDNKILAVPITKIDPDFAHIQNAADLPESSLKKIRHFFETMKQLEPGKWVKTGELLGAAEAEAEIKKTII